MTKVIYEAKHTLYPRLDKNHYHMAADILESFREEHPEFENLIYNVKVSVFDDRIGDLRIQIIDPAQPSGRENFNLIVLLGVILAFIAVVLYA